MRYLPYIFRRIRKSVGIAAMSIVTIALGLGINMGVLAVGLAIWPHPLDVPDEADLVRFRLVDGPYQFGGLSGLDYEALGQLSLLKNILAWNATDFRLRQDDGYSKVSGALVTGNAFSVLQLKPALGRFFTASDDMPYGGRDGWVAVISYSYWKSQFGSDLAIIGRKLNVDGAPVRVIGVMPRGFNGLVPLASANIVLPHQFLSITDPGENRFAKPYYFQWIVLGRLSEGMLVGSLRANLRAIEPAFRRFVDPDSLLADAPLGTLIHVDQKDLGLGTVLNKLHLPVLSIEALAASLLIFCGCNLVLLFLFRANRDSQAAAIRIALGAKRRNEMQMLILETLLLTSLGCVLAVPVAFGAARIISRVIQAVHGFHSFPLVSPSIGLLSLASTATLLISCAAAGGGGILNAKSSMLAHLRSGRGTLHTASKEWIVSFETFASILLVTAVALDIIGFRQLQTRPAGFGDGSSVVFSPDLSESAAATNEAQGAGNGNTQMNRLVGLIRNVPGVQAVGMINVQPLSGDTASGSVEVHGPGGSIRKLQIWPAEITREYFAAMGTRIIQGHDFTHEDPAGTPTCILSARVASALFRGQNPLGSFLYSSGTKPCRVVGVAADAHFTSISTPPDPVVYQLVRGDDLPTIVVKASRTQTAMTAIRNAVRDIAPDAVPTAIETMQTCITNDFKEWKLITVGGSVCACFAAIILGIGFFGMLSLQVSERKREIGLEIALGARPLQVCGSLLKKFARPIALGSLLGVAAGLSAALELQTIYSLSYHELIFGTVSGLLILVLLLLAAALVPMRRALQVSPMECLSSE